MNRPLTILVLVVLFFLSTSVAQVVLLPLQMLVGEWITVASIAMPLLLAILAYRVLTSAPPAAQTYPRNRRMRRFLVVVGIHAAFFASVFLARELLLESLVVGRAIAGTQEKQAIEREVGFKIVVQDVGTSLRVLFLRGQNRKQQLERAFEERRATTTPPELQR
ncbi:MAG: hypothetical protein HYY24_09795 [Verrucomicrobia bacterium]|nr:hypothetical protein [Verrucomicrobiota bacterium]